MARWLAGIILGFLWRRKTIFPGFLLLVDFFFYFVVKLLGSSFFFFACYNMIYLLQGFNNNLRNLCIKKPRNRNPAFANFKLHLVYHRGSCPNFRRHVLTGISTSAAKIGWKWRGESKLCLHDIRNKYLINVCDN